MGWLEPGCEVTRNLWLTETKVPGRNSMVTTAILFITLPSRAAASARFVDSSATVMLALLSFWLIILATCYSISYHRRHDTLKVEHTTDSCVWTRLLRLRTWMSLFRWKLALRLSESCTFWYMTLEFGGFWIIWLARIEASDRSLLSAKCSSLRNLVQLTWNSIVRVKNISSPSQLCSALIKSEYCSADALSDTSLIWAPIPVLASCSWTMESRRRRSYSRNVEYSAKMELKIMKGFLSFLAGSAEEPSGNTCCSRSSIFCRELPQMKQTVVFRVRSCRK